MKTWMALSFLVTALVAGCSQTPSYQLSDADRAKYSRSTPEELIAGVDARLKQAQKDELPLYAPLSYRNAKAAYDDAVKRQQKRGDMEELITNIAAANSRLDAGYQNKEKARVLLAPNYASDQRLQELQAPKAAAKEYKSLVAEMNAIYELVDSGDAAKAEKSRAALTAAQQALKLRLIKEQSFGELKAIHAQLDKEDAADVVPNAMKEAVAAHDKANAFVTAHPDDTSGIDAVVRDAMVMAQRAQWMAARARALAEIDTRSEEVEKILVEEEKWLRLIQEGIGGDTVRQFPPAQQAAKLAERARLLRTPVEQLTTTDLKNEAPSAPTAESAPQQ
jgi:hypothetical protein